MIWRWRGVLEGESAETWAAGFYIAVHGTRVLDEDRLHEEVGLTAMVEEARNRARLGGVDAHLRVLLLLRCCRDLGLRRAGAPGWVEVGSWMDGWTDGMGVRWGIEWRI